MDYRTRDYRRRRSLLGIYLSTSGLLKFGTDFYLHESVRFLALGDPLEFEGS
jgi:hypothetical protein